MLCVLIILIKLSFDFEFVNRGKYVGENFTFNAYLFHLESERLYFH